MIIKKVFRTLYLLFSSVLILCGACKSHVVSKQYSNEEIHYFFEITLGSEYGDNAQVIKKWMTSPRIKIFGDPNEKGLNALNKVINELNSVTGLNMKVADTDHNLEIHFISEKEFKSVLQEYQPVNYGYFWTWWDSNHEIYKATILISTSGISQLEREHLIREELTQSLGFMNDSNKFQDSIFQLAWTDTISFSPMDVAIIEMLYKPSIKPGMSRDKVLEILTK